MNDICNDKGKKISLGSVREISVGLICLFEIYFIVEIYDFQVIIICYMLL